MNYKNGQWSNPFPKGPFDKDGYEMHPRCKPVHVGVDFAGDACDAISYMMGGRLEKKDLLATPELTKEQRIVFLVKVANQGRRALAELFELVPNDMQVSCEDEEQYGRKAGSWGPLKSYKKITYRVRPQEFTLQRIGGWDIGMSDDKQFLTIGCMSFNIKQLQHALFELTVSCKPHWQVNVGFPDRAECRISASRRGISIGENSLKWSQAEELYSALKEWSRRS